MSEAKHTPGEWKVTRKFEVGPVSTTDDQSSGMVIPVADVFGDNREADARLIAAAPDLLAVCREFISAIGPDGYHPAAGKPATDRMRAAIAKAEAP